MRITNNLVLSRVLRDLQMSQRRLNDLQVQVSSGKRILKPEDDPFGTGKALGIRTALRVNESYLRTLEASRDWLMVTEAALQTIDSALERAYVLALGASSDSLGEDGRVSVAKEVEELLRQAVSAANTRHHNRFIFSGYQTHTEPFQLGTALGTETTPNPATVSDFLISECMSGQTQLATDTYHVEVWDSGDVDIKFRLVDDDGNPMSIYDAATNDGTSFTSGWQDVGDMLGWFSDGVVDTGRGLTIDFGDTESLYVEGTQAAGTAGKVMYISAFDVIYNGDSGEIEHEIEPGHTLVVNLPGNVQAFSKPFNALRDLLTDLCTPGATGDTIKDNIAKIEEARNALLEHTATIGARAQAVERIDERLRQFDIALQGQLSKVEDLDMAEGVMRMTSQELAYQTLLRVAATLSQPTLIEFLR